MAYISSEFFATRSCFRLQLFPTFIVLLSQTFVFVVVVVVAENEKAIEVSQPCTFRFAITGQICRIEKRVRSSSSRFGCIRRFHLFLLSARYICTRFRSSRCVITSKIRMPSLITHPRSTGNSI